MSRLAVDCSTGKLDVENKSAGNYRAIGMIIIITIINTLLSPAVNSARIYHSREVTTYALLSPLFTLRGVNEVSSNARPASTAAAAVEEASKGPI
jgi:hypothetical protein